MAPALLVQDLAKNFGAFRAVDGVNLAVEPGQVHALIGPNGAGKTTIFNCISGLLRPSQGRVWLGEREVTACAPHRLVASGLARTFQIAHLFGELSVRENVALAVRSRSERNLQMRRGRSMSAADHEAEAILDRLGLADRAGLRADQLGHGERRLLEIAIALALRPSVLLLDEPTAGLSSAETARLTHLIRWLAKQASILIIEHDTEMVLAISDVITVMTQGRVIACGSPEAISRDPKVRDAYLGAIDASTL